MTKVEALKKIISTVGEKSIGEIHCETVVDCLKELITACGGSFDVEDDTISELLLKLNDALPSVLGGGKDVYLPLVFSIKTNNCGDFPEQVTLIKSENLPTIYKVTVVVNPSTMDLVSFSGPTVTTSIPETAMRTSQGGDVLNGYGAEYCIMEQEPDMETMTLIMTMYFFKQSDVEIIHDTNMSTYKNDYITFIVTPTLKEGQTSGRIGTCVYNWSKAFDDFKPFSSFSASIADAQSVTETPTPYTAKLSYGGNQIGPVVY